MSTTNSKNLDEFGDDLELFKRLRAKPVVAWPSVIVLLVCDLVIALSWYFCITGQLPLLAGCVINSIAMYFLFSPMHDSMHMAVFRKQGLNKISLALTTLPIVPLASGQFLRMMHMQHHRFTNDRLDPDHDVAMNVKNAFGKWFIWGHLYVGFFKEHQDEYPAQAQGPSTWDQFVPLIVIALLLIWDPAITIMLLLIPTFIFSWLIAFVFMYLPHRPHTVRHADDPFKATLIRRGWEWLLTPLMAYQNYHLVHHLYPTVPFYRYRKVWNARLNYHLAQDPAIVDAFQLNPDLSVQTEGSNRPGQE